MPDQSFNIKDLVRKGPKLASDRSELNDALGSSPETSFLQSKPTPAATPQPKPKLTPKPNPTQPT